MRKLKKTLICMITALMMFGLAACSTKDGNKNTENNTTNSATKDNNVNSVTDNRKNNTATEGSIREDVSNMGDNVRDGVEDVGEGIRNGVDDLTGTNNKSTENGTAAGGTAR